MVTIREMQSKDRQAFEELHWNDYWRSHCIILNRDFYNWQFMDFSTSKVSGENDQSIVAVNEDGKVLSYFGLHPIAATFNGHIINAVHIHSWLTASEARGQGVGNKMLEYVNGKFDFMYSRGPTSASLGIFRKFGYRYFKNCSRWIAILDHRLASSLAIDQSSDSIKRIQARTVTVSPTVKFYISQQVPSGAAAVAQAVLSNCVAFIRSHEYLVWRYECHPHFHYVFLSLDDPETPTAFAVLRVEDVLGRTGKVLRVIEFIAPPERSFDLAQSVFSYGMENDCAYADVFGMSERFLSGFISAGGFNFLEEAQIGLPYLLQPYDEDINPPGLLFWGRRNIIPTTSLGPADDMTNIYISKGDGNMDWPSWNSDFNAPPTRLAGQPPK